MPRTPPDMQTGGAPSASSRSDNTIPKHQSSGSAQPVESAMPRQPHERDESSDSQGSAPQDAPSQAAKDVERGLVDTSKAKETNEAYEKQTEGRR